MQKELVDLVDIILDGTGITDVTELDCDINIYVNQVVNHTRFHELIDPIASAVRGIEGSTYKIEMLDFSLAFSLIIDRAREREGGGPYFRHIWIVGNEIAELGWDYIAVAGAGLHDSVEHLSEKGREELPSPTPEALLELKKGFCEYVMEHLTSNTPLLPPEDREEITAILFDISRVPGLHNLLYLESIQHPKARAIKFSDGAQNISELEPFSIAEKVRRIYKSWENIHTGKLYLAKNLFGLPREYREMLLEGYYRLVNATLKAVKPIEGELARAVGSASKGHYGALDEYRGTPHYFSVTYDGATDKSPFCGTLLRYFGREYKSEEERRRLDEEELDNSTLHLDCITARDRIEKLYAPKSSSLQDIADCVSDGQFITGLTFENMRNVSIESARRVTGYKPKSRPYEAIGTQEFNISGATLEVGLYRSVSDGSLYYTFGRWDDPTLKPLSQLGEDTKISHEARSWLTSLIK